jgi:hypothetical protein
MSTSKTVNLDQHRATVGYGNTTFSQQWTQRDWEVWLQVNTPVLMLLGGQSLLDHIEETIATEFIGG